MIEVTIMSLIVPFLMTLISCIYTKKKGNKIFLISTFIFTFIVKLCVTYFDLPSRNVLTIISANLIYSLIIFAAIVITYFHTKERNSKPIKISLSMIAILLVACLVGAYRTMFNVKATYQSIDKTEVSHTSAPTFKSGETPVALSPATVLSRTEKSMSDIPNNQYFSLCNQDDVQAQSIKGKPYYLIPVEYQSFTSYFNTHGTIPGYFKIDAIDNAATPEFVKCPMKYSNSSYFGHNAERAIYRHYPSYITSSSNPQLQISSDGTPYWVETLYRPEILSERVDYSNMKVATLNAKTGKTHLYSTRNLPSWISEGITSDVASDMNESFGQDKYGVFHQWLNKAGLIKPTNNGPENGVTSVFNKDGSVSYFSDFTNINNDNDSGTGYTMINARTGKLTYYYVYGMMDSNGAIKYANQDFKAQRFKAKMPVLYEINSTPTWVMQIVDSSDNIHGYYYLDAKSQSINAYASDVSSALNEYEQALVRDKSTAGNTGKAKMTTVQGTIGRVSQVMNNRIMFMLNGNHDVFTLNLNDYQYAPLVRQGDQVKFKALINDNLSIGNVKSFTDSNIQ